MPLLEIKNLKICYRTTTGINKAVDGISFSLQRGQILGVVGESGCGKTTVAKGIINVIDQNAFISEGKIYFKGKNILENSILEQKKIWWKEISFIPQSAMNSLNPVYKVVDPFYETLILKGKLSKKQALKKAKDLFSIVNLDSKYLNSYPHELSGGMKQRVIIALAMTLNPSLIIADEPVTALDVIVQSQILKEIKNMKEKFGISIILITHDISVVAQICDYIVVMYAGKIVEKGNSVEIIKQSVHPYTLGLENSFPNIQKPYKELIAIEGSPPNLIELQKGCRFVDRCPFKIDKCWNNIPVLKEISSGHFAACFRLNDFEEIRKYSKERKTWTKANI